MSEVVLFLLGLLLAVTAAAGAEYYRQLRRARHEYEKARSVIEDIVLSFNRQFKREEQKLEAIAYRVETTSSKSSDSNTMVMDLAKQVELLIKRTEVLEVKQQADLENDEGIAARLDAVDAALRDVTASHKDMATKVSSLEQQTKQFPMVVETRLESAIPIRKEKAISQLTDTELSVLEMLAGEGPQTAPQIKERVKLSREHTARLMKKLYEEGYLERETGHIPFRYRIKKEMETLLRKPETQATQ